MKQINGISRTRRAPIMVYKLGILLIFIFTIIAWQIIPSAISSSTRPSAQGNRPVTHVPLFLRGYVATRVIEGINQGQTSFRAASRDVYLPNIEVFLREPSSGDVGLPARTDLSGRFTLFPPETGRYQVCWKAQQGYLEGCTKEIFSVLETPVNVSTVRLTLDSKDRTTVLFGQVRMKDGSRPRMLEPLLNINSFARVSLLDGDGNQLQEVFVNNFGEYLLPQVPVRRSIIVRAKIDNATKDERIAPEANLDGAMFHPINITFSNTPPRVDTIVATNLSGQRMKTALPGSKVILQAKTVDREGDLLNFTWRVSEGSLSANNTQKVEWTLPASPGRYSVTLVVNDRKGGYTKSEMSLRADQNLNIPFSGTVDATDAPAISGAEVEINGQVTSTGPDGIFHINVKDANRFVMNIRKFGYGLVSRIYNEGITGGRWTMTRASISSLNPKQDSEVINQRKPSDCPGTRADAFDWSIFPQLIQPVWEDGAGTIVLPSSTACCIGGRTIAGKFPYGKLDVGLPGHQGGRRKDCGPGIGVQINADSLQDEYRNAPTGNLDVALSTIDLMSPEQMPGDYTVKLPGGDTRVMQSYGAGQIEITGGGHRFNLKPGATAKLTIPVDPSQLATDTRLPQTIPFLYYDESEGVWKQEGNAELQGSVYVATVTHFSAWNTDTIKTDQSCVRIKSSDITGNYKLEVTIPLGGGAAPKVVTYDMDQSSGTEHVIYNLPSEKNIVLVPFTVQTVNGASVSVPLGTFIVNTGQKQNPTRPNLPAGPPYNACSTKVTLFNRPAADLPATGFEFLQGLSTFQAVNLSETTTDPTLVTQLNQATTNYYAQIDPRGKRATLEGSTNSFRSTNGFDGTETNAVFANSGDLGFGRDMYCKKRLAGDGQFDVACYVTNYGTISTPDLQDAVDARDHNASSRAATVAMEYSRIENPVGATQEFDPGAPRVVKFYVYKADGSGFLLSANLDGHGERPVPQLCMVCHNGNYPSAVTAGTAPPFNNRDDVNLGSRFLPFDLHYYTFASSDAKDAQQAKFRILNEEMVKNTPPDSTAINEVINKMYSGPSGPSLQDEDFFVDGWNSQPIEQGMYRNVIAHTCRTCHAANLVTGLRFDQAQQAKTLLRPIEQRVCEENVMPHAQVTHQIFWNSVGPHMPAQLQIFGDTFHVAGDGWLGTKCGDFTPGGTTPVSLYSSTIQPIFDTHCTICHQGASPPGGLNLTSDFSYAMLVNVASQELSSMKRIAPNDPANSYLFHKINGTQGTVGGFGSKMPQGCPGSRPCLNSTEINTIQSWINSGAPGP
jgi:hypothetical protein